MVVRLTGVGIIIRLLLQCVVLVLNNCMCVLLWPYAIYIYIFEPFCDLQMSEKDSKEDILKAFKLFDDDETVRTYLLFFLQIYISSF